MNSLKVGFARVDITPSTGISIGGYFLERIADGVLDPLEISAAAVSAGGKTVVFLAVAHLGVQKEQID